MANENRATTLWHRAQKDVSGVAASARCSDVISGIEANIHYLMFTAYAAGGAVLTRDQLITDFSWLEIKLGNEVIFHLTPTRLLDLYKYYWDYLGALAAPLGTLVVPFVRPNMPAFDLGRAFGLGLKRSADPNDHTTHTLSYALQCAAGLVTASRVSVNVIHDLYDPEPPGLHVRTLEYTRSHTAASIERITDFPKSHVGQLAYHWGAGTCTNLLVKKNGVVMLDSIDPAAPYAILQDMCKRTPQAGYTHLDFAMTPSVGSDLNAYERLGAGVVEWEVSPTWSVAPGAGYVVVSEEIHDGVSAG